MTKTNHFFFPRMPVITEDTTACAIDSCACAHINGPPRVVQPHILPEALPSCVCTCAVGTDMDWFACAVFRVTVLYLLCLPVRICTSMWKEGLLAPRRVCTHTLARNSRGCLPPAASVLPIGMHDRPRFCNASEITCATKCRRHCKPSRHAVV